MSEIQMTMQQFLAEIQPRTKFTLDMVEANCRKAMESEDDWKILIGLQADLYTVSLASIKEYFEAKIPKPQQPEPPAKPLLDEFMAPAEEKVLRERIKGGADSGGKREKGR